MKFTGTAAILAKKCRNLVGADSPELRGLEYQASRLLRENPNGLFEIVFQENEWQIRYGRNHSQLESKAAAALSKYAEARLGSLDKTIASVVDDPVTVGLAAFLLDMVPDAITARISDGQLEGTIVDGRATTDFLSVVRYREKNSRKATTTQLRTVRE